MPLSDWERDMLCHTKVRQGSDGLVLGIRAGGLRHHALAHANSCPLRSQVSDQVEFTSLS